MSLFLSAFLLGITASQIFRDTSKTAAETHGGQIAPPLVKTAVGNQDFKVAVKAETIKANDNADEQFVYAWYSLDYNKAIPEFQMISFSRDSPSEITCGIYTSVSDDPDKSFAKCVQVKFENNKLEFKTKNLKGSIYQFEGTFFTDKLIGEENRKVMRGTLRKFVKGKKVAEIKADFAYSTPYCLH